MVGDHDYEVYIRIRNSAAADVKAQVTIPGLQLLRQWKKGDALPLGKFEKNAGSLYLLTEGGTPKHVLSQLDTALNTWRRELREVANRGHHWTCEIVVYAKPQTALCYSINLPRSMVDRISSSGGSVEFIIYMCNEKGGVRNGDAAGVRNGDAASFH